jgi:hypothetical protein
VKRESKAGVGSATGEPVTSLTGLEAEVMGAVWDMGRPVHGMEVAEVLLYARRGQGLEPILFQTVSTTLRRLAEKGVLRVIGRPGGQGALSGHRARTPPTRRCWGARRRRRGCWTTRPGCFWAVRCSR